MKLRSKACCFKCLALGERREGTDFIGKRYEEERNRREPWILHCSVSPNAKEVRVRGVQLKLLNELIKTRHPSQMSQLTLPAIVQAILTWLRAPNNHLNTTKYRFLLKRNHIPHRHPRTGAIKRVHILKGWVCLRVSNQNRQPPN